MRIPKSIRRIALVIIPIITLVIALNVYAQNQQDEPEGLIVSPPYFSKDVESGVSFSQSFNIINQTGRNSKIKVITRDVEIDEDGNFSIPEINGTPALSEFETNGWITYTPKEFSLNNEQSRKVQVEIDMPENMPTKGYYFELVFYTENQADPSEGEVGLKSEIAVPIILNYFGTGEIERKLELVSFEADHSFYEFNPVNFETRVLNKGNVHIIPIGQITVSKDKDYKTSEDIISLNPNDKRVFSDSGRLFENEWNKGFITRDSDGSIKINWKKIADFRIGRYHAKVDLIWDAQEGKEIVSKETSFFFFPWRLVLLLCALILSSIMLYTIIRKYKERKKSK